MNDVLLQVRDVFAEVTRYPLEILNPQANLEQELGIDSVKMGEVFSVLRERFKLPPELEITREDLATIDGVSKALLAFVGANGKNGVTASPLKAHSNGKAAVNEAAAAKPQNVHSKLVLRDQIKSVFAEVTRYPAEILEFDANLEEDLGIDSVKMGEVFAVLRERYSLPLHLDVQSESLRTISAVTDAIQSYLATQLVTSPAAVALREPVAQNAEPDLLQSVRNIFAAVTRYPLEILAPDADLEQDLGIDSVKLGEVFSVLRERYALLVEIDFPRESLGTISGIAGALQLHLEPRSEKHPASHAPVNTPSCVSVTNVEERIIQIFAEVTRYPEEILDPQASLEEDLGIDSVKLGEVFSVIRERFKIPELLDIPQEQLRTIRDIASGLKRYVVDASAPPAVQATTHSAPPGVNGNGTHAHAAVSDHHPPAARAQREAPLAGLYAYEKPQSKPFAGKVLFVSGSGRGLGRDVASYLGDLGASVVVNSFHSRNKGEETAEEIRSRGGDAIHLWGSMANPEHVTRVFDEIDEHYGRLDFFIGNASNGMLARLEDLTIEHWEKAYRTNVIGLHQSALRSVQLMRRNGGGKIITLSSPAAHGYVDYFGCMGTVKAAVESLTRSMAIEFAKDNIQVNCVSPGPVYGELLNKWPDSERLIKQWESNTAYDRLCEARDVSHFIAYLLSEPVKLFTGSVLVMDGGISSQGW
jgi:enoyl-[acyl-carrier protein] reductase III